LYSIIFNSPKENLIHFYILSDNIREESKFKILSLKKDFSNFEIEFINVDSDKLDELKSDKILSRAVYSRIYIPDLLPGVDRIIYLDCDTIVLGDINKLWSVDLEDFMIGAVNTPDLIFNKFYFRSVLNIDNSYGYFNSGVLLLDLKKMRENKFIDEIRKIFNHQKEGLFRLSDEQALNQYFYAKWKKLDIRWNKSIVFNYKLSFYNKEEKKQFLSRPYIIHYVGKKPFNVLWIRGFYKEYFSYFNKTILRTEYSKYRIVSFKLDFRVFVQNLISTILPQPITLKLFYFYYKQKYE